jgi:hypothetical protein
LYLLLRLLTMLFALTPAATAMVTAVEIVPAAIGHWVVVRLPFPVFRLIVTPPLAWEVRAVIRTLLPFILRSWTVLKSLDTSEVVEESVLETEPMGLRREDVSSKEVEEWVSPPEEDWGLPFPVDSRSRWAESHLWCETAAS